MIPLRYILFSNNLKINNKKLKNYNRDEISIILLDLGNVNVGDIYLYKDSLFLCEYTNNKYIYHKDFKGDFIELTQNQVSKVFATKISKYNHSVKHLKTNTFILDNMFDYILNNISKTDNRLNCLLFENSNFISDNVILDNTIKASNIYKELKIFKIIYYGYLELKNKMNFNKELSFDVLLNKTKKRVKNPILNREQMFKFYEYIKKDSNILFDI